MNELICTCHSIACIGCIRILRQGRVQHSIVGTWSPRPATNRERKDLPHRGKGAALPSLMC